MHHEVKQSCCAAHQDIRIRIIFIVIQAVHQTGTQQKEMLLHLAHIKKRQRRRNGLLYSYCVWFNSLFSDSVICNCNSTQFNHDTTLPPITVTTQIFLSFIRQRHQSSNETTCNYLHQDLSAGQHTVLIGESLAQVVKGGHALPETKQLHLRHFEESKESMLFVSLY